MPVVVQCSCPRMHALAVGPSPAGIARSGTDHGDGAIIEIRNPVRWLINVFKDGC